jgi:hypothetical protein
MGVWEVIHLEYSMVGKYSLINQQKGTMFTGMKKSECGGVTH